MAEKTLRDLIKVLKQNDLNSGQDADRQFAKTEAVHAELKELNKMLGSYFGKQEAGKGDTLEEKREAQQKSAARQKQENKSGTFKSGLREGLGLDFLKNLAGLPGMLFSGVMGGTLMSTLLPAFGKILGRTILRGPLFGALALFGEDLIKKGFDKLTGGDLTSEQASTFNSILTSTLIGSIFGKRGAIAGFVFGVIDESLSKAFNLSDENKQKILGIELPISEKDFATWGGTIAAFFAPGLIGSALRNAFTGKSEEGGKLKDSHKKRFNAGFLMRRGLGWGSVLLALGGVAGTVIGNQLESEDAKNTLTTGLNAAAIGWMAGGPWGALIAGIGVLAYSGMSALGDWFRNRDNDVRNAVYNKFKKYENLTAEELENLSEDELEKARVAAAQAYREAQRAQQLAGADRKGPEPTMIKAKRILGDIPLVMGEEGTINQAQIDSRIKKGLEGNLSSIDELLKYYISKGMDVNEATIRDRALTDAFSSKLEIDRHQELQDLYASRLSAVTGMNFADPNFELPNTNGIGRTAASNSLLARLLGTNDDAFRNLLPPQVNGSGANATVIDNSSRNSSTQNTGLLLNGGPAVDNFTPY